MFKDETDGIKKRQLFPCFRAYLDGKRYVNIFFYLYFSYEENGANSPASLRNSFFFQNIFFFG